MQAIEALADAQTGEFERLKEFGIRARQEGDRVTFTYQKNGKEISRTAKQTGHDIRRAITGIWSDRFDGMMDRQSKTFNGLISNLKDGWTDFMLKVGQAGIFDKVKASAQRVLGWLNARLADGSIAQWADQISKRLEVMWEAADKFIRNTDWDSVASDIKAIADAAWTLARGMAAVVNWSSKMSKKATDFNQRWSIYSDGVGQGWTDIGKRVFGSNSAPAASAAQPRKAAARGASTGQWIGAIQRAPSLDLRTTGAGISRGAPARVKTSGVVDVRVRAEPGTRASVAGVKKTGDIDLAASSYRGGMMARVA
jgi:phage tail tape-measure protein